MKKCFYVLILFLALFIPNNVDASQKLYLFYSETCPHCKAQREYLDTIKNKYKDLEIIEYETENNIENNTLMRNVKTTLKDDNNYVPYTVIGTLSTVGYSEYSNTTIENMITTCIASNCNDVVGTVKEKNSFLEVDELNNLKVETKEGSVKDIPLLGDVDVKKTSIPLVGVILGFIDGFNPCAMWVLIFLINMLIGMKNRRKMWWLGFTFLFCSGLVYFLSMLGISVILSITSINIIRDIIAIVAVVAGVLNFRKFFTEKTAGCSVVDKEKRSKISDKIKKFMGQKNMLIALIGVASLAISVNLVELSCSLGFPVVYSEILALNGVTGVAKVLYLLLYILFYMLDDIIVFTIAMVSLKLTGLTNKFNRYSHLIGGLIMILLGILLIFKPEWVMFNFK